MRMVPPTVPTDYIKCFGFGRALKQNQNKNSSKERSPLLRAKARMRDRLRNTSTLL